ncbi:MAG: hypothetical protein R2851_28780 [Caldilineaceae bacterium]
MTILRLPNSIRKRREEEFLASWRHSTRSITSSNAARGSGEQLLAILERAPDVEPDPEDRLP